MKKKNIMRLKSNVIMFLILSGLLIGALLGGMSVKGHKKEKEPEPVIEEPTEYVMPDSFLGSFKDEKGVPEEIRKLLVAYFDSYYRSLYKLETDDASAYFENEFMASVNQRALDLLLSKRKKYDFDFSLSKGHYDLTVSDYREEGSLYYVDLLEDDYFNFAFLNGIESSAYDIENHFVIVKSNDTYKIKDYEKVQGFYQLFYDDAANTADVEKIYDYYREQLSEIYEYYDEVLKNKAKSVPYSTSQAFNRPYDRKAAVDYSYLYYHERNKDWYNFTDEGGNCQNYASQVLLNGGIAMDHYGDEQWKCYIEDPQYEPAINEEEKASGRTRSWVNVNYFYNYARDNEGKGLVADVGCNLYYAQPGDIVIVGNGGLAHTFVVSQVIGQEILVNSNSIDMKDFPLDSFVYTNMTLIKILGSNQE